MSKRLVKYVGPKKRMAVCFPVPFMAMSMQEGDVLYFPRNEAVECTSEQADQLLETSPAVFKEVEVVRQIGSKRKEVVKETPVQEVAE